MRVSNVKELLRMMGSNVDPRLARVIITMAEELAEHRQQILNLITVNQQMQEALVLMHTGFSALTERSGEARKGQHVGTTLNNAGVMLLSVKNPTNADLVASEPVSQDAVDGGE